ncbi:MutS-related protein [Lacticaseibacillus mingshuiensis]|uniref:DNA mismatch repair proteins mutS family domain-containing protein n=1 Tax=Lacticaseibacillus mingshuiensis TaxID=2799574 RepID=A0ABW4CH59_9LACO|nr:hypothetical protein [Lacticaseibacillus mingshuiensis]
MFKSLLFPAAKPPDIRVSGKAMLTDLHLDQVFHAIQQLTAQPLDEFLLRPLTTADEITYRQAVFADLADSQVHAALTAFSKNYEPHQAYVGRVTRVYEDEVKWYTLLIRLKRNQAALHDLATQLAASHCQSAALLGLQGYLTDYFAQPGIQKLESALVAIQQALGALRYRLVIDDLHVTVEETTGFTDGLHESIGGVFAPMLADQANDDDFSAIEPPETELGVSNLQAMILRALRQVFPEAFAKLLAFYRQYLNAQDEVLDTVAAEVPFYLAVQAFEKHLGAAYDLPFCLPTAAGPGATEQVQASFDLALAAQRGHGIVTNDYRLAADEQFLIISGPNQGGKTTYARMVGENYYLYRLGIPIPGRDAALGLKTQLFTHFERAESAAKLTGLLAADVDRIYEIVNASDAGSFVIMNELFSSTTAADAEKMGREVLTLLAARGAKGIYVTFLDSLATLPNVVPMMSQVASGSTARTYKVVRTQPDGQAYALSLLAQYGLRSADILKEAQP